MCASPVQQLDQLKANVRREHWSSWLRGDSRPVEWYLEQHPEIAGDSDFLLDLLYDEIHVLEERGQSADEAEYCRRFPALAAPLHDLLEVHRAVVSASLEGDELEEIDPLSALGEPDCGAPATGRASGETLALDPSATPSQETPAPGRRPGDRTSRVGHTMLSAELLAESPASDERPARDMPRLDDYEFLEEIGRGGMGVVYKARQKSLDRIVALKVIRSGHFATPREIKKFHEEARAAAAIRHSNIVAIHEMGEADGQPFFSMDYVEGTTLAEVIRERPISAVRAATYLRTIAEAVEHAHQHHIIHRDLKPSNILIDREDRPQITDFGLAKRLDQQASLGDNAIVGTAGYMSPEQINPQIFGPVGPTTDVYALGAVLYELLVGRPPFQAADLMETMRQVVERDPVAPRVLDPAIDRDIETICLKCLEKDQRLRYGRAGDVADDLRRFLQGEPILARPISRRARLWRRCKRQPGLTSLVVVATALLLVIVVASPLVAVREKSLRSEADAARELAEQRFRIGTAHRLAAEARSALAEGAGRSLRLAVEAVQGSLRRGEPPVPVAEQVLRDVLQQSGGPPLAGFRGRVQLARFSPNGQRLALTADGDNLVRLWDFSENPTATTPHLLDGHVRQVSALAFSPDGSRLVTADWGGTVYLWTLKPSAPVRVALTGHRDAVYTLAFSADGRRLLTAGGDGTARLWDLDRAEAVPKAEILRGHGKQIISASFRDDGRWLVTACAEGIARLWDLRGPGPAKAKAVLSGHEQGRFEARFVPRSRWLLTTSSPEAAASPPCVARLWDVEAEDPAAVGVPLGDSAVHVSALDISSDGRRLVIGSLEGRGWVWDLSRGEPGQSPMAPPVATPAARRWRHPGGVQSRRPAVADPGRLQPVRQPAPPHPALGPREPRAGVGPPGAVRPDRGGLRWPPSIPAGAG